MSDSLSSKPEVPYFRRTNSHLVCEICPRECDLSEGQTGICRSRKNISGVLRVLNYGETASIALDPIEKKPLYHFHPGSNILSAGPNSCNFNCKFCQNWEISQEIVPVRQVNPQQLVEASLENKSIGLAYTYSEPLMWYEFLLECGQAFHDSGMVNVLVSNGYINPEPFKRLIPLIDAMNIDLKSIDDSFYQKLCGGVSLQPVLETIKTAYEAGIHIELTQLLIPGENDSDDQLKRTVKWIAGLGRDIPIHFSRYFPRYKFDTPPTESSSLKRAYDIASGELEWVYVGNISLGIGNDSVCPDCGAVLVARSGYFTTVENMAGDNCKKCGRKVYFRK